MTPPKAKVPSLALNKSHTTINKDIAQIVDFNPKPMVEMDFGEDGDSPPSKKAIHPF